MHLRHNSVWRKLQYYPRLHPFRWCWYLQISSLFRASPWGGEAALIFAFLRLFFVLGPVEPLGTSASHDSSASQGVAGTSRAFQGAGGTSLASLLRHGVSLCSCSCFASLLVLLSPWRRRCAQVSTLAPTSCFTRAYGPLRPWDRLRGTTMTLGLAYVDWLDSSLW